MNAVVAKFALRFSTRSLFLTMCVGLLCVSASGEERQDSPRVIDWAESFVQDASLSSQQQLPIVVFVSQHGCEFCEILRKQVIYPMMRSGKMQEKAILRELSLNYGFEVQDFDGDEISGREFVQRYANAVTPTLLFLGPDGQELARKTVGITNIEYYSYYLRQSLEKAIAALGRSL